MCDLESSRIGAPYIYDISNLRVNGLKTAVTAYMRNISQADLQRVFASKIK
jgi:hypothetical protein